MSYRRRKKYKPKLPNETLEDKETRHSSRIKSDSEKMRLSYIKRVIKNEKNLTSYVTTVDKVNWEKYKPKRAGIIPYQVLDNEIIFYFGIDFSYKELSDFGGSVDYKKDINAVDSAFREFFEESLNVFPNIDNFSCCPIILNDNLCTIFYRIDPNISPKFITEEYQRLKLIAFNNNIIIEMFGIQPIYSTNLLREDYSIKTNYPMYSRIENLLYNNDVIFTLINTIYNNKCCGYQK